MVDFDQVKNNDDDIKNESLEELKAVTEAFGIDDVDNEEALLLDSVTLLPELFDDPEAIDGTRIELPKDGEFVCPSCNLVAWAPYANHVRQQNNLPVDAPLVCADCQESGATALVKPTPISLAA